MAATKTPAVRHLRYEVTNSGSAGTETSHYIDLARDLSAINRRMMEQGRVYHVSKITVVSRNTIPSPGQSAGFVSVGVAPNSWVVRGAVKYGKQMFKKMQDKALEGSASDQRPKYNQFIVRSIMASIPNPTYLVPKDNGGNNLVLGEWPYSIFQSPDGTTGVDSYGCSLLGAHNQTAPGDYLAVSLVQSYGDTRASVTSNTPLAVINSDDPLGNLFDDGTQVDEILADMGTRGDEPPYSLQGYPGNGVNMPQPLVVQHGTLGQDGRVTLGGFEAVCGLIELETSSPVASDVYSVLVELKAGPYKGIAAEAC